MNNSKRLRAIFLLVIFVLNSLMPPLALALTGGPSQPEVQSFEPAGTTEMVDLSSGSFTYNIPLMDVGGYPLNLSYNAGVTMDQEASCVGLGWNINPGVINRNMRGLPDDFDGEDMVKELNMKTNWTFGGNIAADFEIMGSDKLRPRLQAGMFYNSYKGIGLEFGVGFSPSLKPGELSKDKFTGALGLNLNINLNSQNGATSSAAIQPTLRFKEQESGYTLKHKEFSTSGGLSFNSKQGLMAATLGANMSFQGVNTCSGDESDRNISIGSSTFSFAKPTFLPTPEMPVSNFAFTLRGAFQFPIWGFDPGASLTGYFSRQQLASKRIVSKAYGTMYIHNQKAGISVLDFNREKDGPFTQNTPNLSVPVATPDIYAVSGQGIGGSYLLKRGDIGVFSDKESIAQSSSGNFSLEVGAANLSKLGIDIVGVGVEAKSTAWKSTDNELAAKFAFKSPVKGTLYEAAYFKPAGERSVEGDTTLFESVGKFAVIDAKLERDVNDKFKVRALPTLRVGANYQTNKSVPNQLYRNQRDKRNQSISYLTAEDASIAGLQTYIQDYTLNNFTSSAYTELSRVNGHRKSKHISEITSTREDGIRYVYGVPAYNIKQQDYHFSVNNAKDCKTGLVTYTSVERSKNNSSGRDNFYSMEETPPYAHSYLLTAVLSNDYSDVDAIIGPSSGDLGSYTKFNYSKIHNNYKWRLPYADGQANRANSNAGLLSDKKDDKASVIYGEKEIWNLHSIESKTYVAQFYYSDRNDGLAARDIDVATGGTIQKLVKLDSIKLYSKLDIERYGAAAAVPIKQVTFKYNYKLCKGVPNNIDGISGKLTLEKIYFTYGNSQKGRFSPYVFEYKTTITADSSNFVYNYLGYNRWGSFQKSLKSASGDCLPSALPGNDDYPYVIQDSLLQSTYATAWNLTGITLPSGGKIEVTYEPHDYAYTQNKSAMEMMKIEGLGKTTNYADKTNQLFLPSAPAPLEKTQNDYLYFKLNTSLASLTAPQAKDIIARDYLKDIVNGNLYFKCLVDLKSTLSPGSTCPNSICSHYEYVYGYASISDWGKCTDNGLYGYLKINLVCLKDKEKSNCTMVNPISKAGWQFTRIHYPDLIHQSNLASNPDVTQPPDVNAFLKIVEAFADLFKGLETTLTGLNRHCLDNNYSQKLEPNKSWVRLYNPTGKRLAGGSRVKRIKIADNWQQMSTVNDNSAYGQEFTYRTELDLGKDLGDNITKRSISSGVASYEPMLGGDENPFRQPETYDETLKLAPDNHYYQESPSGESFFPSPNIVYSKVTVKSLKYDNSGNITNPPCVTTGTTVSEYYTAKDFPTRVTKTPIQVVAAKSSPLISFLRLDYKEFLNASQGFCIELNDMHGKPKAQWNFDDKGQRVSGIEYIYKTKKKDSDPLPNVTKMEPVTDSLENKALVILRNGTVEKKEIGVDFQVTSDSRESFNETRTRGVAANVDVFLFGIFPFAAIVPWPVWETEKTRFRSMAITKVINRYALLEKVIAYDATSRIETENIAYDAETGEVLLTRTYNEYGDPIYNLKYPAHFVYRGMRAAYENIGVQINNAVVITPSTNTGTTLQLNPATIQYFEPGDELLLTDIGAKGWVLNVNTMANTIDVINTIGQPLTYTIGQVVNFKIVRSGKRNQQVMSIGSVTLKDNPIVGNTINFPTTKVLEASAIEYSDYWHQMSIPDCTDFAIGSKLTPTTKEQSLAPPSINNPYRFGERGIWRQKKNWVHLKDRTPVDPQSDYKTNIRTDGVYTSFTPFWAYGNWSKNTTNWTWASEVTKYSPYGFQLETVDPLNRFSAELPGYNNTQAIAVAANARYKEIHFDGFEENGLDFLNICSGMYYRRFPIINQQIIDSTYIHTGNYSMKVIPNGVAYTNEIRSFIPSEDQVLASPPATENTVVNGTTILPTFGMMMDSVYLISAWVRTDEPYAINKLTYKAANNVNPRIEVEMLNAGNTINTFVLHPTGNVIEGWQSISGLITIPKLTSTQSSGVVFRFKNGPNYNAYFDDFRVQPFRSTMKTFVYDLKSTRLLATLDDRNYATFYEYNQEGMLLRVKRETEKGIMTVQESKTSIRKQ